MDKATLAALQQTANDSLIEQVRLLAKNLQLEAPPFPFLHNKEVKRMRDVEAAAHFLSAVNIHIQEKRSKQQQPKES